MKNFGFISILSAIFFEHVPGIRPIVDISPHGAQDLAHLRWANVMQRLGRGQVANPYPTDFFLWWHRKIIAIDDYPYEGIEFCGDLDIPIPPRSAYGEIGNNPKSNLFFELLNIFVFFNILK